MSVGDKAKHTAQDAKGKIKEAVGKATGNEQTQAEGQADQDVAHAGQAADKAKETAKNVGHQATGKAKEVAGAVTDDDGLEAKGKAEQLIAKGKQHLNK
ncbi:CsbD family protein [Catenulispora sp. NF23]|uniref:CsbD family protein n=1 Tax=Catenulispora pinistramenti TaxID=2705254 RepID=A0ABS5KN84_9ACTN|nr:CsbD family protein [Catenulispora pinistramenti]MBS2532842.1 CsbD family protein [Catenulispora pinistramenti]MBS2547519.1 CsbD family protein [Catenulispora pinistramenti]